MVQLRHYTCKSLSLSIAVLLCCVVLSCTETSPERSDTLFSRLDNDYTGIHFKNEVQENLYFNFINYSYIYNGGGVAVGDINNDGLEDLYFSSNQGSNALYLNKGDFRGQRQLAEWQERGFANTMVTLEVHDTTDADAIGGNPIMLADGTVVGRATSGGYGFRLEKSLALAMVRPDLAIPGVELMIDILDQRLSATVLEDSPYDPNNVKLRA